MIKKHTIQLVLLAAFAIVLAACSIPTKKVTLVAEDIVWNLETIEAKVNQRIEITLRNEGVLDHDFVIEDLGVDVLLSPGDVQIVKIMVDHAGTITYICNIPGHEEAGMVGQIIITD